MVVKSEVAITYTTRLYIVRNNAAIYTSSFRTELRVLVRKDWWIVMVGQWLIYGSRESPEFKLSLKRDDTLDVIIVQAGSASEFKMTR